MILYTDTCPLISNLSRAFLKGSVEGYNEFEMYKNLLNSKYNNCLKIHNVPLFYRPWHGIFRDITTNLQKSNDGRSSIIYLVYAYAYVCYRYRLSFTELEEILPIRDQLDISYANSHFMERSCARHIEALYLDTIKMRWA